MEAAGRSGTIENHFLVCFAKAEAWAKEGHCAGIARPNILMFSDFQFVSWRSDQQAERFRRFVSQATGLRPLLLEIGAGTFVPTIRHLSDELLREFSEGFLIRINPREPAVPSGHLASRAI